MLIGLPEGMDEWLLTRKEEVRRWPQEKQWALQNLTALRKQLVNVTVATKEDGSFVFTKRNARMFSSRGKKDFVSAAMYCRMAFLMWLRSDNWRSAIAPEDEAGCGT